MIEKCDFWHLAQWMAEQFKDMSEAEIRDADQIVQMLHYYSNFVE